MKIAVVGAGVSGLVAAHLLADHHDVQLIEADARPGGHTNTVAVSTASGDYAVDTGFIVLNDRNYPNFRKLLDRLGVPVEASNMSFSVSDGRDFEYAATSLNGLYANRAHLLDRRFTRMIAEVPRFQRVLRGILAGGPAAELSLAELLARERFSRAFAERLIIPQVAAVWSADPSAMDRFPARFLAEFFANHGMLSLRGRPRWQVITGGSRRYVDAIVAGLGTRLQLRRPVTEVRRQAAGDGVLVRTAGAEPERFDEVILACHSDQALALLADPTAAEAELLGAIPYQPNEAILHTDVSLLPRRRRAWASWNYHLVPGAAGLAAVTYHMNRLQNLDAPEQFCVTLNRSEAIDPGQVIARFRYAHPVFTPAGLAAQARVEEISGTDRIHFCGAYWGWGFHEDGVVSALRVARHFGVGL